MKSDYFKNIQKGLQQAIDDLGSRKKLTLDVVFVPDKPKEMKGSEIAKLRHELGTSQGLLAMFMNVSHKTVQAWEHNQNRPSGSALRLLRMLQENPKILRDRLRLKEVC